MDEKKALELAKEIVNLDLKRDELYEELVETYGKRGEEILRWFQNGGFGNGSK